MTIGKPAIVLPLIVAAAMGAWPAAAPATFHEVSVREVYAGSAAQPGSQYVELQAWSAGQNFVGGHVLKAYDASGVLVGTSSFGKDAANGVNQATFLLATPAAEFEFGVGADAALTGTLDPAGGAVCWEALDCVSWGSFSGTLPSPAGPPATAIPEGMALRRTIAPICPTLLDAGDDHDNSATDFSAVFPSPRPNSSPPSERRCPGSGSESGFPTGGGGPGKRSGPQTVLRRKPGKRIHDRTPTFRFASNEPGSTFQCKLDGAPFKACRSPFTTRRLGYGAHTFKVRARDDSGQRDATPASYRFRILRRR
jgi:hypothetical protein